jgi:hypothetical protein
VLVPLAHASLASGVVLSLGTTWGLVRHYWVVLKLLITAFSTIILLIYMTTFREMAGLAADSMAPLANVRNPSPVVHAILASMLLVVTTLLGIYKPLGLTPYGRAKQGAPRAGKPETVAGGHAGERWGSVVTWAVIGIGLLLVVVHLMQTGFHH